MGRKFGLHRFTPKDRRVLMLAHLQPVVVVGVLPQDAQPEAVDRLNGNFLHPPFPEFTANLLRDAVVEGTEKHLRWVLRKTRALHYCRRLPRPRYGIDDAVPFSITDEVEDTVLFGSEGQDWFVGKLDRWLGWPVRI